MGGSGDGRKLSFAPYKGHSCFYYLDLASLFHHGLSTKLFLSLPRLPRCTHDGPLCGCVSAPPLDWE
jgi:hypothetical protein